MATQHDMTHHDDASRDEGLVQGDLLTSTAATEPAPGGVRGRLLAVLGAVAVLVVAAVAVYLGQRGDHSVTVTDRGAPASGGTGTGVQAGAVQPEPVTGLHVTVAGPAAVRVGEVADYTVSWTDDDGTFVGSTQDWGDIGDGSSKQGRCTSTARVPGSGSFAAGHTWTKPGTYTVKMTVTTQACSTGAAVTEDATGTATVVVSAS